METFGKFMLGLLLVIPVSILRAWVFSKLWLWFIVSTFVVEPISTLQAFGILIFLRIFTMKYEKDADSDEIWVRLVFSVFASFWILLVGWIVSLFF